MTKKAAASNSAIFTAKLKSIVQQQMGRIRKGKDIEDKMAESFILEGMLMIGQGLSLMTTEEAAALRVEAQAEVPVSHVVVLSTPAKTKTKPSDVRKALVKLIAQRPKTGATPPHLVEGLTRLGLGAKQNMVHYHLGCLVSARIITRSSQRVVSLAGAPPSYVYKVSKGYKG
jgi:hypothetical protein